MMNDEALMHAFAALAQPTRMKVFRLLVREGPDGLPAGDIARRLNVPQNTLSTHLAVLARGRLVRKRRAGRHVIYAADMEGVRDMIRFLTRDCCHGHPEKCEQLLDALLPECGPAAR
ncbi:MAG TPA: ArsR family transcriptional regulator [Thermopetrobacter sp.]|nr:ArsR family transcriptional regulator [Thermopetrobacter sp.]